MATTHKMGSPKEHHDLPDFDDTRAKLSWAARTLAQLKRQVLDSQKKNYCDLQRPDFLWHYLLQSFATMGGISGWQGLIGEEANYSQVTFTAISNVLPQKRLEHVSSTCAKAKIRYGRRKAAFIVACHERIHAIGGQEAAKKHLLAQPGRDGKIAFLKSLPGIGEKYARNIMMDVYHEDFRDSIAIDSRILAISTKWGLTFKSFSDHEAFYLAVASGAGLNGWELDRLMFAFRNVFYPPISGNM